MKFQNSSIYGSEWTDNPKPICPGGISIYLSIHDKSYLIYPYPTHERDKNRTKPVGITLVV